MIMHPLSNGWDAEKAYQLTLLNTINDMKKYRDEWNNLPAQIQIEWAIIAAKIEMLDVFQGVK